jgi:hypothetical protein
MDKKHSRLKSFSVETTTRYQVLVFLTKAKNGKEALKNLICKSNDFRLALGTSESNNMIIKIEHLKSRG